MTVPESPSENPLEEFPIVGIGASAGGLAVCEELLRGLPPSSGLGFVLVQHLAPGYDSQLATILARSTAMKVVEATEGLRVDPDHVYVIPPGTYMKLSNGCLHLEDPGSPPVRMPIDHFFRSLAEERAERSAGIVLSGTGSDGSLGIRAIRGFGGITIVQDPETAQYDAMPRNAIATGMVDHVAPIASIPGLLMEYARRGWAAHETPGEEVGDSHKEDLNTILALVLTKTRSDFRCYKKATILRRVQRRMGLVHSSNLAEYVQFLRSDPQEATALAKDLLIGVTSFFRDPESFEALRPVLASLVVSRGSDHPIRVWVPGCATGEEAYSIVILLLEVIATSGREVRLQVFATDVDESAVSVARAGIYPASIAADVSFERLSSFFVRDGDQFRVAKQMRDRIVFAVQNVVSSPAFSRIDLISCRNTLIYLEPDTQKRVLDSFGHALTPSGILFLGKSDGLAGRADTFEPVSKRWRIFRAKPGIRSRPDGLAASPGQALAPGSGPASPEWTEKVVGGGLAEVAERMILDALCGAVVIADQTGRVMHLQGAVGRFLEYPAGDPPYNVLHLARGRLASRLRSAFRRVVKDGTEVRFAAIPIREGDRTRTVDLVAQPLRDRRDAEPLIACLLTETAHGSLVPRAQETLLAGPEQENLLEQMEFELRSTREELQGTIEEMQTSNEELKAANEEVMSMNEELQSTNEEMETSKEELQSLNEELTTVNAEMQDRMSEVTRLNDDLSNLISSTEIATVFLDTWLRLKRYTPMATRLLNLIPTDVGRPIGDLTQKFDGVDLAADAEAVLRDLRPIEREVQGRDGSWYTMRILLYRTGERQVDGVVVTFTDVTRFKAADEAANAARQFAENIVETIRDPLLVLDRDRRIISANEAFYRLFGERRDGVSGRSLTDLDAGQWNVDALRQLLDRVLGDTRPLNRIEIEFDVPGAGRRSLIVSARRVVRRPEGSEVLILLAIDDITDERKVQKALVDSEARLSAANQVLVEQVGRLRALAGELTAAEDRERRRIGKILHDHVQQLLVAAKLHVGVLRSGAPDDEVKASAAHAEDLLDQSIAASRSLTVELSPPVLHDAGLAAGLEWLVRRMREQHGLLVELALGEGVEPADPEMRMFLFEAARELLFNVVKHAGVRRAKISVERAGGDIVIRIEDQGRGLDPGSLQGRPALVSSFGLFTIQQRAELLGGVLTVEGAPGQGTRVTLTAPAAPSAKPIEGETPGGSPPAVVADQTPSPGDSAAIRVLLVDDHEMVRQGLATVLRAANDIEVVGEAANGVEAIERARQLRPSVVVMDVNMPVMNGIDATRQIASEQPGIRVIGLSLHDGEEVAASMREAGAIDFVTKGGRSEVLISAIRAAHRSRSPG